LLLSLLMNQEDKLSYLHIELIKSFSDIKFDEKTRLKEPPDEMIKDINNDFPLIVLMYKQNKCVCNAIGCLWNNDYLGKYCKANCHKCVCEFIKTCRSKTHFCVCANKRKCKVHSIKSFFKQLF